MEAKEKIERFVFVGAGEATTLKKKAKECYFMLSFKYNITEANSTGRIIFMQRIFVQTISKAFLFFYSFFLLAATLFHKDNKFCGNFSYN